MILKFRDEFEAYIEARRQELTMPEPEPELALIQGAVA